MYDIKSGKIKNKSFYFEEKIKENRFKDKVTSLTKINTIVLDSGEEYKYNAEIKEDIGDNIIFYTSKENVIGYIIKDVKKEIYLLKSNEELPVLYLSSIEILLSLVVLMTIFIDNTISHNQVNILLILSLIMFLLCSPIFYFSMRKMNEELNKDIEYTINQILKNEEYLNTHYQNNNSIKENETLNC